MGVWSPSCALGRAAFAVSVALVPFCYASSAHADLVISDGFSNSTADNTTDPLSPDGVDLPGTQWYFTCTGSAELKRISTFTETGSTFGEPGGTPTDGNVNFVHGHGWNVGADSIAIASTGSYTKPQSMTIQSDICLNLRNSVTAGLGFYSTPPASNSNGASQGNTSFTVGFTGLALSTDGSLTLYANGVAGASIAFTGSWPVVTTGTPAGSDQGPDSGWHTLSYTINTATGAISNVSLSGSTSSYSWNTTAFTDPATNYATNALLLQNGTYSDHFVAFDNFSLSSVPEPGTLGIAAMGLGGVGVLRRRRTR